MKTIDNRLTGNGQKPISSIMQQTNLQLLPLIMNNIPQAVFWKDRDLIYLGCNQAFAEDAGLSSPEAIIGKTDFDMPWKEQAELYRADDQQVMEKGEPKLNYEEPQTTPNGSRIWLSTSKIPIYENDRVVAVLGMYEDITPRKQAEALLHSMIESAPEAVGIIDLTTGLFTEPNENAVKLYGLSREELVKVGPAQMSPLVQPDGRSSAEKAMEKINLAMQGETPEFEWMHCNARGEDIPCEVRLARLPGDHPKVRFSVTDITERKRVERMLNESEERYRRLSEATVEGIVLHEKGILLDANEVFAAMFGYELSEVIGMAAVDFLTPETREITAQNIRSGYEKPYEVMGLRKDGSIFPVEITGKSISYEGRTVRVTALRDVTERKQAEESLQKSEGNLASALHVAKMGHWEFDIPTQTFTFNDQYYSLHGTTAQEVGGYQMSVQRFAQEFVHPEDAAIVGQATQQAIETTDPDFHVQIEARILRANGETRWVTVWFRIEKDKQGRTVKLLGVNQDITERKQLENQVQEAFERRGRQVQLSTQVSQAIAAATNLEDLYQRVVTQVKEQFDYYHTQILRYDAMQDAVVLVTGYGEAGQKMLAAGHRLPMGKGLIGTAADTGETVLRPTLENDSDWQSHPLLPDTKGEIAVPIKLGNNILGVLDVQSNVAGALDIDDKLLLEGLCGQIAVAMESTRLSQEMAERLQEINRLYRAMSHEGWQTYGNTANIPRGFMFDQGGLRQVEESTLAEELFANIPLTVPGGEVIGTLAIADDPQRPISSEDKVFLEQVSEQVALALESARLFEQTQSALATTQESEAKLSEALNIAKLANWEYDVERDIFLFNDHFYSIFHATAEQVGGYELSSADYARLFVHPDDLPIVGTEIEKALASKDLHYSTKLEHRVLFADGGTGYISVEIHIDRDENGKILRYYGANQDITERKKAEIAIQESEAKLSEALNIAKLANWEYEFERDRFIFNDNFYSIFHTTAEQVGGYELSSADYARLFVHPDDAPIVGNEIGKAIASTDRHYNVKLEHRILFADGGTGYISVDVHIERDENGKITRWYGANQDITERKKAELVIQESEERLSEALNIARLANWEYDVERDRFIFNDNFYSIFHTTVEQVGGYELSAAEYSQLFVHPDDAALVGIEIGKALASTDQHYSTKLEHRILFADGGMGYISVDVHIERDENGKITRWYGANQDITERKKAEEILRVSEARLSEALGIAKLAHWEYDFERDIFTFNDHFYSIFHTTAEKVGGYELSSSQYVQLFVLPEDADVVGNEIGKAIASTERHFSAKLEHRINFADGGTGYIAVEVHVERDENGKITRWYGANQDITERKRAEEAVKAEQQRVQLILESVTIPMVITRLSDNHLTFVNVPALDVTQFKYEEVINQPSPDFYVNPDDRKNFITELRKKGEVSNMVVQLRRINGEGFWALLSAQVFDYQGEASILTTFMDITDRIRAQEAVAKRATELQTVATVSTTAATTLEPDRLLQAVVDLTKEQFGLYHAHIYVVNESWNTLLLAAGAGEVGRMMVADNWNIPLDHPNSMVAAAAQTKKSIIANDVRRDKDSGFLSNRLLPDTRSEMAVPMIVGEKVLGVFDVQSDAADHFTEEDVNIYTTLAAQVAIALQNARLYVEQAAAMNQLRELDRLKSSFLANMSHELRTPLNSILGFTDVMLEGLDGNLTDYMDNDLRLIQKNGQHLLHLINDVLDMAKIESGRMNLHPETFKVHSVLEEVTSITSTLASEKNLALFIEENSDQELKIYADNTRLRQVMINLVNNSIKFTEKGRIGICAKPIDGARVLITVKDTGIGIPPEQLEAIFQEFTQVDTSSTRKVGGTGLGLPISRRLVEMHGGRVWAESTGIPGEGSTLFVELPIEARITDIIEKQVK